MTLYIFTLTVPSLFLLLDLKIEKRTKFILLYIFLIYLIIFIGLRHHTGGDWQSHVLQFYKAKTFNFFNFDFRGDYLYDLLNFIISKFIGGLYSVNLILSILLVLSVYIYSSLLPQRFLVLIICFPYIFVVVGMGFVRQGMALSFILISLYFLNKKRFFYYLISFILAVLSHKSIIILFLINLFIFNKNLLKQIILYILYILIFLILIYSLKDNLYNLYYYYIGAGVHLESYGSIFRNLFNTIPVIIFILFFKKFKKINSTNLINIYVFFAIYQIVLLYLSFEISTFADRMTIYSLPIQLFVYSNLFLIFDKKYKFFINFLILFLYNIYFLTWINVGIYSHVWFPYKNIIYEYFFAYESCCMSFVK